MSAPALSPVRMDVLRTALVTVLTAALPGVTISWGRGNQPESALGDRWASLQIITGPGAKRGHAKAYRIPKPVSAVLEVPAVVAVGELALVGINAHRYRYDVAEDDDQEAVTAALQEWIDAQPGVTAEITDDGEITVTEYTGDGARDCGFWHVGAEGIITGEVTHATDEVLQIAGGMYGLRIEAQTFARLTAPQPPDVHGAQEVACALQSALTDQHYADLLDGYGVRLGERATAPLDISALSGPYWQSRATYSFDVRVLGAVAHSVPTAAQIAVAIPTPVQTVSFTIDLFA